MSDHLRPTAEIASNVLLPADPGLAMAIAQRVTAKPLMANHHHGLWGYSGQAADGTELTVQASGIGGPSAVVVLGELAAHGVTRAVRVGRCEALDPSLAPGSLLVAAKALGDDGASQALGEPEPRPHQQLVAAVRDHAPAAVDATVAGCDLLDQARDARLREGWRRRGATAVDLETAPVLAAAGGLEVAGACLLVVSRGAEGERDEPAVEAALVEAGAMAARALAAFGRRGSGAQPVPAGRAGS